jgi:hypothetical protein
MTAAADGLTGPCSVLHRDRVHPRDEVVVGNDGVDRDQQAGRGGHEGGRDALRDDLEATGARDRHRLERLQDADDRAEQADEWRRGSDGAQGPEITLEAADHDRALRGHRFGHLGRDLLEHQQAAFEHVGEGFVRGLAQGVGLGDVTGLDGGDHAVLERLGAGQDVPECVDPFTNDCEPGQRPQEQEAQDRPLVA